MINPWKSYKSKSIATIVKIDPLDAYIPYVTLQTDDGRTYEGSVSRAYSRPHLLKVGDRVEFSVQWSIVADKPMVDHIVRKRWSA